jgi:hypothetical protein
MAPDTDRRSTASCDLPREGVHVGAGAVSSRSEVALGGRAFGTKRRILERYSRTDDGRVVIDIAAGRIADLYDDFDKHASYLKKELDQELVDYIIDSVREIGREPFLVQLSLAAPMDAAVVCRVQTSLHNYFLYLRELEAREMRRLLRTSVILFVAGAALLTASVWMNSLPAVRDVVLGSVIAEGLTIAAWVSLWEALAMFLVNWAPHRRLIGTYERIAKADVRFQEVPHEPES